MPSPWAALATLVLALPAQGGRPRRWHDTGAEIPWHEPPPTEATDWDSATMLVDTMAGAFSAADCAKVIRLAKEKLEPASGMADG